MNKLLWYRNLLRQEELFVRENLESTLAFTMTSSDSQNELTECITMQCSLKQQRKSQIPTEFTVVQVDETPYVSFQSQMSIVDCYCVNDSIQERFMGFFDVSRDKLPNVQLLLSSTCRKRQKCGCEADVSYDGASLMAGSYGGVTQF